MWRLYCEPGIVRDCGLCRLWGVGAWREMPPDEDSLVKHTVCSTGIAGRF